MICFSDRESYGITFIEAMLSETILISPSTGVLDEFNEKKHYISVCQHSVLDLKQSLAVASQLSFDESVETKRAAFSYAQKYTWTSVGPKLINIFSVW